MKKSSILLKFLFWMIVGLIFFIPSCMLINTLMKEDVEASSIESYTNLKELIDSVKDGEVASIPLYMNKKSVVVGFSIDNNRFENHYYHEDGEDEIKTVFDKPLGCENCCEVGKACLCLCSGYERNKGTDPYSAKCEDMLICNPIENRDILSYKEVKRRDNGQLEYSWKGGFLLHREISNYFGSFNPYSKVSEHFTFSEDVNGLEKNTKVTRTIYVERYKNVVDVCLAGPCMTDETKAHIDASQS